MRMIPEVDKNALCVQHKALLFFIFSNLKIKYMCKFTAEDAQNLNKMAKLGTFQSLEKVISLIKEAAMKDEEVIHLDVRLSADVAVALRNRGFKVFGDNVSWKVKEEPQLTWNSTDEEY